MVEYFGDVDVDFDACGHCDRCDSASTMAQVDHHPLDVENAALVS